MALPTQTIPFLEVTFNGKYKVLTDKQGNLSPRFEVYLSEKSDKALLHFAGYLSCGRYSWWLFSGG